MAKRRDRDEGTSYGQRGPGRPKIGGEEVHATLPAAHVAGLDAIAATRGLRRPDVLREAVAYYLDARAADGPVDPADLALAVAFSRWREAKGLQDVPRG